MELAAFFVQPDPPAPTLQVIIFDAHADDGADAGEGVDHQAEEGPIAESDHVRGVDRIEQLTGFVGSEHTGLALPDGILGARAECAGLVS